MTWLAAIVGMFFNTFVNPIALNAIAWKYYIVFVVVLIMFGITAYFFYPETKGYSLEEISTIFDGPREGSADHKLPVDIEDAKPKLSAVHDEVA